jgi:molybdate transport system substrate-binding protein
LAVKKGAPHPDISSVEAFKRTLLNAKSIAYIDPASGGTSGIHLAQTLEKLGIRKARHRRRAEAEDSPGFAACRPSSARVGEIVQRGEAEIGCSRSAS